MDVIEVLHMNGGTGDASYANNSLLQKKVISMTMSITEEAITDLYCNATSFWKRLCIADLGCSSGPNTFLAVSEVIKMVDNVRIKQGHNESPEFQVYLNDLPGNDFNSIFRSLPRFQEKLRQEMGSGFGPCFFTGVPGSFYDRLFGTNTLHFVYSSYSLHWLSQFLSPNSSSFFWWVFSSSAFMVVPVSNFGKGMLFPKVPEVVETNKGNIYMASTSPASVLKAYHKQFQNDFSTFLKCRSEELVAGGRMVLTFLGRKSDEPSSKECCYIWELLSLALKDLVLEGLVEEKKLDGFNIPLYTPSGGEVKHEVEKEGSFLVDRLEVSEVSWSFLDALLKDGGYNAAKYMRAVAEPLLVSQFGEAIMDKLFQRYGEIIADRMSKEKTEFINVSVSMTRKAG